MIFRQGNISKKNERFFPTEFTAAIWIQGSSLSVESFRQQMVHNSDGVGDDGERGIDGTR
jgi:hypothetical protein